MAASLANFLDRINRSHRLPAQATKILLSIFACIYRVPIVVKAWAWKKGYLPQHKLPVPVISIGNITTGGTGKTPATVWIVKKLIEMEVRKPVILSRGYGQDEALLLRQILPQTLHYTNKKRYLAGCQAIAREGENVCFVLDDGFQHRYLQRDLDIVLIDATRPFGHGHLLPRGFLREPLCHLRRADIVIVTRCDLVTEDDLQLLCSKISHLTPDILLLKAIHKAIGIRNLQADGGVHDCQFLANKNCLLFAAIGNPESFSATITRLGASIREQHYFRDHYQYSPGDLSILVERGLDLQVDGLITTAKDAVKLRDFPQTALPLWVLDIELQLCECDQELTSRLQQLCKTEEQL